MVFVRVVTTTLLPHQKKSVIKTDLSPIRRVPRLSHHIARMGSSWAETASARRERSEVLREGNRESSNPCCSVSAQLRVGCAASADAGAACAVPWYVLNWGSRRVGRPASSRRPGPSNGRRSLTRWRVHPSSPTDRRGHQLLGHQ